jgi:O-acetyl-ADP-ribose deacetylase (regulator of RNase III)
MRMIPIQCVTGDATEPIGAGEKLICHVCNNAGKWGGGFVLAISKKWKEPEKSYRALFIESTHAEEVPFIPLGVSQFINVEPCVTIVNMVAQHQTWTDKGVPPIRYYAVEQCLKCVAQYAALSGKSIHAPRFGAGLAGGDWSIIEGIIIRELCSLDIPVFIYDLPKG